MGSPAFLGKIVAFWNSSKECTSYGCVVAVDSDVVLVVEYTGSVEDSSLDSKLRCIAKEDVIIQSLQSKLRSLREKYEFMTSNGSTTILEHTVLQWAKKRLRGIERKYWLNLSESTLLSESLKLVCNCVTTIVQNSDVIEDWKMIQGVISEASFVEILCGLDERPLRKDLYQAILVKYVSHPLFSLENCMRESRVLGALQKWITAYLDYQRFRFFSTDASEIKHQIDTCVNKIRKAEMRRQELKNDTQLILSGCLFSRTERVQSVPLSACLCIFDRNIINEQAFYSISGTSCNFVSCNIVEKSNTSFHYGSDISKSSLVTSDGAMLKDVEKRILFLNQCCEKQEKELEHLKLQNDLLQREVDRLNAQILTSSKFQLESQNLELEINSLRAEKNILLQDVSKLKKGNEEYEERRQQQEMIQKKELTGVLALFKNLEEVHQSIIEEYEKLFTIHTCTTELVRKQTLALEEKQEEIDILRKYLGMARRELLLTKSIVFLFRHAHMKEKLNSTILNDRGLNISCVATNDGNASK
ncbi:uncharacterized protein TM35_000015300 [Trypanosoma theileri]|uniref:Uncharacterized protein n=1 Tax=Trypanosoma theileri TaxID=67003 RepID=A0A1X0PAK3_9TRYP|nr:uncharacterized protein TM35_000015300 [Trypanosoma theileri]ORC93653.1 hypothetical protein TM35_000015300 [Trypanosoma theileri]